MPDVIELFGRPLKIISRGDLVQKVEVTEMQDRPSMPDIREDNNLFRPASGVSEPATPLPEDNTEPSSAERNHIKPRMPYINSHGSLIIPFDSDPKYHYWNGGQSLIQTLQELNADEETINRYKSIYNT